MTMGTFQPRNTVTDACCRAMTMIQVPNRQIPIPIPAMHLHFQTASIATVTRFQQIYSLPAELFRTK
jgi:hypothetical protein